MRREKIEEFEADTLSPYATLSKNAEREFEVRKHPYRTEFQRDRDRILHSKAFRRLEYKTQVFMTQINDHLRTRLTHSLEVSQIARTIANQLELNNNLVEAIALGHDLGHSPFGHAGEGELSRLLEEDRAGYFNHNVQSVKILKLLETKYHYNGLRLTKAVLESILKHTTIPKDVPSYCDNLYIEKNHSVTLEGQIVCTVDEIAQITHDMDDYLRYNIIELGKFMSHQLFDNIKEYYKNEYDYNLKDLLKDLKDKNRKKDTIIRCMIDYLVSMLIKDSRKKIKSKKKIIPYKINNNYISFEENRSTLINNFHDYLNKLVFNDHKVDEMDKRGKTIIRALYKYYKKFPKKLPEETYKKYKEKDNNSIVLADYISGMTDRYALNRYDSIVNFQI